MKGCNIRAKKTARCCVEARNARAIPRAYNGRNQESRMTGKIALLLSLVPAVGVGLRAAFC